MSGMIGVDVGGTFTDVISIKEGKISAVKVPTNPESMELPVIEGAELVGANNMDVFNHASTAGLNAVLTRNLPKIAFLTTEGHRDMLDMGRAWRPLEGQTSADWRRSFGDASAPLVPRYLRRGIKERIMSNGEVLIPFDEEQAYKQLQILKKCNVQGVSICLINAYVNADHEIKLQQMVKEVLGDIPCSISSSTSPLAKEYPRASTTVIDVFMKIIYEDYSENLINGLRKIGFGGEINFADCAANLSPADFALERPHKIVFSGPSSGTVSSAHFGSKIGEKNILCCDIGGTSCDISIVKDGKPTVTTVFELEHDLLVNTLTNEVSSIGAGGGSIVKIDPGTGELRVGPESAGGKPGPACYGKGGKNPTVTDTCLLIGILNSDAPLGGRIRLDKQLAVEAFQSLPTNLDLNQRVRYAYEMGLNEISEGIVDISVKHGIDPRDYSLIAYGSAGPMLLPAVLEKVGAKSVLIPPYPGLFSALGLLSSDLVFADSQSAYLSIDDNAADRIMEIFNEMESRLLSKVSIDRNDVKIVRTFDGHLAGQTWETPFIPLPEGNITSEHIEEIIGNFHDTYEKHWGNRFDGMPVVGVTFRLQIVVPTDKVSYPEIPKRIGKKLIPIDIVELQYISDSPIHANVFQRDDLYNGDIIVGPAIIREALSTTFIERSQSAKVGQFGEITITRV
ncbi:hydantoinase/oxoprolinase family protein [Neobacillus vireti]|uniref:5-oxoprolinase n=1 Tax=Neobacillus vireti LMG 21834 TaxID=1131730 RepID=A0AB94IPR2_9BACI|nr:hydantoinase/oxoprolinase family protein [Neobacillus vireti]ETI69002.1 5-oxoprolinase [Neobacillus vireti LMG 21834]